VAGPTVVRALVAVVLAWGVAWVVRSAVGVQGANYYDPVTVVDYVAVWSYSAVLLLSASICWIAGSLIRNRRAVRTVGWIAAVGFAVAGVANGLEDGFAFEALGAVYVIGILSGAVGALVFAAALFGIRARSLAGLVFATDVAFIGLTTWFGLAVLAYTLWFAWRVLRGPGTNGLVAPAATTS
jgi:hypothetical protein